MNSYFIIIFFCLIVKNVFPLRLTNTQWNNIRLIMNNPHIELYTKSILEKSVYDYYRNNINTIVKLFMKEHPVLCKKINDDDIFMYAYNGFYYSVLDKENDNNIIFENCLKNNIYKSLYDGINDHKRLKSIYKNQKK